MFIALSVLLALACLVPAAAKLSAHPAMQESARHFGIPWRRYRLLGAAELAAAAGVVAGLWWHPLGLAAAAGMAALLIGALITHRRAGDSGKETAPALVTLVIAVAYLAIALAGEHGSLGPPPGRRGSPRRGGSPSRVSRPRSAGPGGPRAARPGAAAAAARA